MGIIVNLANRTIQGFGIPVGITDVNEVTVTFSGYDSTRPAGVTTENNTYGTIDRVTGDVYATNTMFSSKKNKVVMSTEFILKCRPAQRIF